ncbi:MAG TPA: MazG family protein [Actinomycetota bacterium]|nr:MazG family protein [Actinomycetota bacterium]
MEDAAVPLGLQGSDAAARAAVAFEHLVAVMARLRAPGGCPWDAEQTHQSLAVHLLEEAHETLDAIDSGNMADLEEELGDLLLQVVFHAEIAAETGGFEIGDVVDGLVRKLVDRHPHVFGEVQVRGSADVVANWETLKKQQKGRTTLTEGLPKGLPALVYAHKVLRRVSGVGHEFDASPGRLAGLAGALGGAVTEETVGDLLLEVVALAGAAGIDPEGALRRRSNRLIARAENPEP